MVMPGLVNIHAHPSSEPMNKGLTDEIGSPGLYNSSLYEYMPIFRADAEAVPACVRVALSELLLSGVTTLADLSMAHPGWLDLLAEAGMRVACRRCSVPRAGTPGTDTSWNTPGTKPPVRKPSPKH